MSFDERFRPRWEHVIEPGIRDAGLDAFRVDVPKTSTSIPADIIRGIAESRLVLVDVSVLDGHRNGNVMYELGIAHACRQPEEVLLFRSDNAPLLFDVATIRVNSYDVDSKPAEARALVRDAVASALREVDLLASATVVRAADALDVPSIEVLMNVVGGEELAAPRLRTAGEILGRGAYVRAIDGLLDRGLIVTVATPVQMPWAEMKGSSVLDFLHSHVSYRPTALGRAVMSLIARRWNIQPTDTLP